MLSYYHFTSSTTTNTQRIVSIIVSYALDGTENDIHIAHGNTFCLWTYERAYCV